MKISSTIRKDTKQRVRLQSSQSSQEIIDGNQTMLLFSDDLDGVAQSIPTLDLEMEAGSPSEELA